MHSKKKGKSGRKRPKDKTAPAWLEQKPEEIQERILHLRKEGVPPARIGQILRDQHAVPSIRAALGISMGRLLRKENVPLTYPEDLINLIRKAVRLQGHLKNAKKDRHNRTRLARTEAKIQRLVHYYTRVGKLPAGWRYDPEKAALLVR